MVDCVCCANNCNQKYTVLVPRIPVSTKCRMQTENLKSFFRLVCDNMLSYNLPSVT